MIFIKWHGRSDSSITEATGTLCRKHERPAAIGADDSLEYSRRQTRVVNAGEDWVNLSRGSRFYRLSRREDRA